MKRTSHNTKKTTGRSVRSGRGVQTGGVSRGPDKSQEHNAFSSSQWETGVNHIPRQHGQHESSRLGFDAYDHGEGQHLSHLGRNSDYRVADHFGQYGSEERYRGEGDRHCRGTECDNRDGHYDTMNRQGHYHSRDYGGDNFRNGYNSQNYFHSNNQSRGGDNMERNQGGQHGGEMNENQRRHGQSMQGEHNWNAHHLDNRAGRKGHTTGQSRSGHPGNRSSGRKTSGSH
jgi:hypothetical protein